MIRSTLSTLVTGLSALADGESTLEAVLRGAAEAAVPVIVLGEYRYRIGQSRERQKYAQWLNESIGNFRILDGDEETAASYARVRKEVKKAGTPIPSNDAWIAALCRQHKSSLVSRDRHFDTVPRIQRIDW